MTPCVVSAVITGAWLLALILTTLAIILGYYKIAKYGICFVEGAALVEALHNTICCSTSFHNYPKCLLGYQNVQSSQANREGNQISQNHHQQPA